MPDSRDSQADLVEAVVDAAIAWHKAMGPGYEFSAETDLADAVEALLAALDAETGRGEWTWVPRTWVDVRTGDTVRMPGQTAIALVQSAAHQRWRTDPRSSEYRPVTLEWECVQVRLRPDGAEPAPYRMDPTKPVEIRLEGHEVEAMRHLAGFYGGDVEAVWRNRVGIIEA